MKSKIYIQNLKKYPEIIEKLKLKYPVMAAPIAIGALNALVFKLTCAVPYKVASSTPILEYKTLIEISGLCCLYTPSCRPPLTGRKVFYMSIIYPIPIIVV